MPQLQQQQSAAPFTHNHRRPAGYHRSLPERHRAALLIIS